MKKSAFWKILIFLMIAACAFLGYVYFAEPDFLLDRVYPRIYADRLAPEVEVMLNENPAAFDLTEKDWSIEKNNGTWYLPPGEAGKLRRRCVRSWNHRGQCFQCKHRSCYDLS